VRFCPGQSAHSAHDDVELSAYFWQHCLDQPCTDAVDECAHSRQTLFYYPNDV
jgi:hypothetical protein